MEQIQLIDENSLSLLPTLDSGKQIDMKNSWGPRFKIYDINKTTSMYAYG